MNTKLSEQGYIKLFRSLRHCWVWNGEKFSRGQAWIDLLFSANHQDEKVSLGSQLFDVKKGSFITSKLKLADRWSWSNTKVDSFLKMLEQDGMITVKSDTKKTFITIENWELYQSVDNEKTEQKHNKNETETEQKHTNNNEKNEKNDKNDKYNNYCVEFEELWKLYPRKVEKKSGYKCYCNRLKNGNTHDDLLKAVKNYAAECNKNKTEEKFIKHMSTFFSANEPFKDYIEMENDNGTNKRDSSENYEYSEDVKKLYGL